MEEIAVDTSPRLVVVARQGMSPPDGEYVRAVLRSERPDALDSAVQVPLSQPRWPNTPALMDSCVEAIVRAIVRQHGVEPVRSTYSETKGPDGAQVILVMVW